MRAREEMRESQINAVENGSFNKKRAKMIFWNLSSVMIGVYLWFLRFSNILLKLVQ